MAPHAGRLRFSTAGGGEVVDLTDGVASIVGQAGAPTGIVQVFGVGATVAVTTMEYEPGAVVDLRAALERLLPAGADSEHNRLNADTNGHSHLRAALIGASETIPVAGGRLVLGTWQRIVFLDLDVRPRERTVQVTVIGG
jgi:secondary thiamine-phosphate synthase enzyme